MRFGKWLNTYEKAVKVIPAITQEQFTKMAKDNRKCCVCGQHVWRFAEVGLCFTCTTGEADSSNDYEIGEKYQGHV